MIILRDKNKFNPHANYGGERLGVWCLKMLASSFLCATFLCVIFAAVPVKVHQEDVILLEYHHTNYVYKHDDVGLRRLTLKDVEELL